MFDGEVTGSLALVWDLFYLSSLSQTDFNVEITPLHLSGATHNCVSFCYFISASISHMNSIQLSVLCPIYFSPPTHPPFQSPYRSSGAKPNKPSCRASNLHPPNLWGISLRHKSTESDNLHMKTTQRHRLCSWKADVDLRIWKNTKRTLSRATTNTNKQQQSAPHLDISNCCKTCV